MADAKIEKGFFLSSDGIWTCYRRNYFAVSVHYNLSPWTPNGRLYLNQGNGKPQEQIQVKEMTRLEAIQKILDISDDQQRDNIAKNTMERYEQQAKDALQRKEMERSNYEKNHNFNR